MRKHRSFAAVASAAVVSLVTLVASSAFAGDVDSATQESAPVDVKSAVPITAYTYSATGAPANTMGAYAYGTGVMGGGTKIGGGGATAWWAPVERLTLVVDGQRDIFGQFAPSAAGVVRLFGKANEGFSLGAIGKFKVDGFGVGPKNEMESEVEGGLLLSYARSGFHADLNAITGFGTGDDGEKDGEGRLRVGYDVARLVRVGLDGQARYRMAGTTPLVGGRSWDFAAGPQVMVGTGHFFAAATAGPTTMNVASGIGATGIISIGGTTL